MQFLVYLLLINFSTKNRICVKKNLKRINHTILNFLKTIYMFYLKKCDTKIIRTAFKFFP